MGGQGLIPAINVGAPSALLWALLALQMPCVSFHAAAHHITLTSHHSANLATPLSLLPVRLRLSCR